MSYQVGIRIKGNEVTAIPVAATKFEVDPETQVLTFKHGNKVVASFAEWVFVKQDDSVKDN